MEKIDGLSMDVEKTEREKLASVFPQCFVEGRLDIDRLLNLCGEYITPDSEKYEFRWKGKAESLQLAQQRSTATLRPCPEESVDFDTTQNLYIEGDNLEVLKLLQNSYHRRVKMIYIDPPYNTGNDFVYEDDFADTLARYKEVTSQTTKSNPESMGRFHTNWLNMMYPRLRLAANLLRDDGVIFISIDDNEVHNLRKVCDEVFGEENFVAQLTVINNLKGRNAKKNIATCHEYLLIYGKPDFEAGGLPLTEEQRKSYNRIDSDGNPYQLRDLRKRGGPDLREDRPNMYFPIYYDENSNICSLNKHEGWIEIYPMRGDGREGRWRWGKEKTSQNLSILEPKYSEKSKRWGVEHRVYLNPNLNTPNDDSDDDDTEERRSKSKSFWDGSEVSTDLAIRQLKELFQDSIFDYPKSIGLIKRAISIATSMDSNDLVLDFFSGTSPAAHAVMQLNKEDGGNRRFIMIQLPEIPDDKSQALLSGYKNVCEIGKERIRRAGAQLQDGQPAKKPAKQNAQLSLMDAVASPDSSGESHPLDTGFKVFKLDSSNLKTWDGTPVAGDLLSFTNRLNDMVDRVKPDRTDLDMVYEIMLKMGIPLSYGVKKIDVGGGSPAGGKPAYAVGDFLLLICLAQGLTPELVEQLADYAPGKLILADHSLAGSTAMANAHYILRDRGVDLKLV